MPSNLLNRTTLNPARAPRFKVLSNYLDGRSAGGAKTAFHSAGLNYNSVDYEVMMNFYP